MITHVLTFILGFITNTVTDWVFAGANKYQEKRSFGKLIKGFRKYTDQSKLFSIGPLITDCIVWKGIDEKNQRSYSRGDIELEFHQEATNNMTQDMQLFIDENWKTMILT
ncbi:MAG TPA: hypothetical protein VIG73_07105 [Cerasibacillus sp.]|uniref:hypothetical protein n=1 Tax=Cerasibacillus sp. TaxID=2498711 RepID=UPI002F411BCA